MFFYILPNEGIDKILVKMRKGIKGGKESKDKRQKRKEQGGEIDTGLSDGGRRYWF